MKAVLQESPGGRRLATGWALFALGALALSTVFAVLVVGTRTPLFGGFAGAGELFRSALVMHVAFALLVWLFVCAAAIWTLAAGGAGPVRRAALALACMGAATLAAAPFFGTPLPVLSNYIPVLDSNIFLVGLAAFVSGIFLNGLAAAGDLVRQLKTSRCDAWRFGAFLSIAAAIMALYSLAASMATVGVPSGEHGFELLFWGPGHLLQFVNVLLMMTVWIVLGERALGGAIAPHRWLIILLLLAALPILAAPVIHALYPVDSPNFRRAFTALMTFGLWPAPVLLAFRLLLKMVQADRTIWSRPETRPLAFSILLLLLGCIIGASIHGETTMVTAHYHSTVGALTMAYMGFGYSLLMSFGYIVRDFRLARWQLSLYASGQLLLTFSLAWLGMMDAPRKTPHSELAAQSTTAFSTMELGGLLSLIGVALFVFSILNNIRQGRDMRKTPHGNPSGGNHVQRLALMASPLIMMAVTATYLPGWLNASTALKGPAAHAREKANAEVQLRFEQGVAMLNAKQYDFALTSFHRVLQLAPDLPEAHVNMGFALIGLQRYAVALDFFETAIELRKDQINAYYGLAEALEGLNDIPGALGAMRTYIHRSPADDPYRRRAEAAVWEWETKLKEERTKPAPDNKAGPIKDSAEKSTVK